MPTSKETTGWRATGSYLLRLASKTSLIEETRQFLLTYERVRDIEATRQALVNGGLPQRSRATRLTILEIVQIRLTRWHPPAWVLDDLITFAQDGYQAELQAALLLHTARQDNLLYDYYSASCCTHIGLLVNANLFGLMCSVFSMSAIGSPRGGRVESLNEGKAIQQCAHYLT